MAFEREPTRIPQAIEDIEARLFDPNPAGSEERGAQYSVQIRFSDGSLRVREGDLVPHLTAAQISALQGFMATLRAKALAELLPSP